MEKIQFKSDPLDARAVWLIPPGQKIVFRRRYLVLFFFLLVPMSLTAILGTITFTGSDGTAIASFWPAAALQIVFSIWFGIYGALAGVLGPMLGNGLVGDSFFQFIPGNAVQSCLTGLWFRYRLLDPRLRGRRDWLELVGVGILLSNGIGAVLGVGEIQLRGIPEFYLKLTGTPEELHRLGFLAGNFFQYFSHHPILVFWVDKFPDWFIGNVIPCLLLVPAMLKTTSPMIVRDPFFCQSFRGGTEPPGEGISLKRFNDLPIIAKLMLLTTVAGLFPLSIVGVLSIWNEVELNHYFAAQSNYFLVRNIRTKIERHDLALRAWAEEFDRPGLTASGRQELLKTWKNTPDTFQSLGLADRAKLEKRMSPREKEDFIKNRVYFYIPDQTPNETLSGKVFAAAWLRSLPNKVLQGQLMWREETATIRRMAKREALIIVDQAGREVYRIASPALAGWQPNRKARTTEPYIVNYRGSNWYAAEAELPSRGWRFITLISTKKAQAKVRENTHDNPFAVIINLAIFGSVIAGSMLARRISDRVLTIAEYVQAKGAQPGQLQIPIRGRDELGYLGQALNQMSQDLAENIRRLKETMAEKERLAAEMELARQVQMEILPKEPPHISGYEFAAVCHPAREVGGDFYDFIPAPNGQWVIIIGDVAGKGLKAAMYVTETHGLVHWTATAETNPERILEKVNTAIISSRGESSDFVTLFCAVLHPCQNRLFYSSAGHNPPILLRQNRTQIFETGGLPLAIMAEGDFSIHQVDLDPGDTVVMYTDGVTEAMNSEKQLFGMERFNSLLQKHADKPLDQLHKIILQSIFDFAGDTPQSDDITLLSLRRNA